MHTRRAEPALTVFVHLADAAKQPVVVALPSAWLKYHSLGDTVQELGPAGKIREVFVGFQQYLY